MNPVQPVLDQLDTIIHSVEDALKVNDAKKPAPAEKPADPLAGEAAAGPETNGTEADAGEGEEKKNKKDKKKDKKNKVKGAGGKDGKPVPLPVEQAQWLQCDVRVGRVSVVGEHPEASGLYVLEVSYGDEMDARTVCAGLRNFIPAEEMRGRRVVTICNLKPRKLRGIESQAMILAGSVVSGDGGEKETVVPLAPPADAPEGAVVSVADMDGLARTVEPGKNVSGKTWDKVVSRLTVKDGAACYDGAALMVGSKSVECALPDGSEIH